MNLLVGSGRGSWWFLVAMTAKFDWVADPGSFLGKQVENSQYVCHPDFEPPRLGEKRRGSFTAYMAVDYDRIDYERDIQPYRRAR